MPPKKQLKKPTKASGLVVVKSKFGSPLTANIQSINAGSSIGLPDRLRIKLSWSDQYAFQSAASKNNLFRANSVFDPDASGVFSNAPAFYNFWKSAYNKYVVLGAKIQCHFDSLASEPAEAVLWASDVDISSSTFSQICSSKRVKHVTIGPTTGMGRASMSMQCSTEEVMGQKAIESDSALYAAMNANPVDVWYFGVAAQTFDASNLNLYIRVTIEMDVVLKDLSAFVS